MNQPWQGAREQGSGTILAIVLLAVVFAFGMFAVAIASAHETRWQAQIAADLGAIAGATALRTGFNACEIAGQTVVRNHASLVSCAVHPFGQVVVSVQKNLSSWGAGASASALAGPRQNH
jgi:secretion/DNA translocation related TadE-like protein